MHSPAPHEHSHPHGWHVPSTRHETTITDLNGQARRPTGSALTCQRRAAAVKLVRAPVICALVGLHGDDNLAASLACFQRPHGLGNLAQRIGPADEWPELAGLDQLPQDLQVLLVRLGGQHPQPLTHQP